MWAPSTSRSVPSTTARDTRRLTPTDTARTCWRKPAITESASPGGSRRWRATSNDDACRLGIIASVKMPRMTSRMASVEMIRTMPNRAATAVATVDLPTPVDPPMSTMRGPERSWARCQVR